MNDTLHPYKDKTKTDSYSCELKVNGSLYFLTPLAREDSPHPDFLKGYRLEKQDPKHPGVYDVVLTRNGFECDCHDFQHRRKGVDSLGCKHLRAMFYFGFLRREEFTPAPGTYRESPRVQTFPEE